MLYYKELPFGTIPLNCFVNIETKNIKLYGKMVKISNFSQMELLKSRFKTGKRMIFFPWQTLTYKQKLPYIMEPTFCGVLGDSNKQLGRDYVSNINMKPW